MEWKKINLCMVGQETCLIMLEIEILVQTLIKIV